MNSVRSAVCVAVLLLVPALARADVLSPGYVEHCTMEETSRSHSGCEECRTSFQDPDACSRAHATDGRTQACRTAGGSVWTEIWCGGAPPPSSAAPATTSATESGSPPAHQGGGCSVGPAAGAGVTSLALAWLVAGLFVVRRRVRG